MSSHDDPSALAPAERSRSEIALDTYLIGLSVLMMALGLHQWAIILGIVDGATGPFEAMTTPWKIATMYLSAIDLVASVGLWMRAAWGKVVWLLAALSEIALHTVFIGTFGSDLPVLLLHFVTIAGFAGFTFLARRA